MPSSDRHFRQVVQRLLDGRFRILEIFQLTRVVFVVGRHVKMAMAGKIEEDVFCLTALFTLQGFIDSHEGYLSILNELEVHLRNDQLAEARRSFDFLAGAFEQHESSEEQLLGELDRDLAAALPAE